MTTISGGLPTLTNNNSTEDPITRSLLSEIKSAHNTDHAAGAHPLSWLASGAAGQVIVANGSGVPTWTTGMPDTALASPNNSVYKTLLEADAFVAGQTTAGTYLLGSVQAGGQVGGTYGSNPIVSGTALTLSTVGVIAKAPSMFDFDDADFTVGSLTQKLRLRAIVASNATAPAINFTFGLYPLTVAGGANAITYTAGTVVPSSTLAINAPSASTVTRGTPTADFTIPADGAYALGVVTSGTIAASSTVSVHAYLQTRNV